MKKHNAGAYRRRKVRERALVEEQQKREARRLMLEEERIVHAARRQQLETNPQSAVVNTVLAIMDQAHLHLMRKAARKGLLTKDDIGGYDGVY